MPQDAFTLKYISKELNDAFVGGKISKINQPSKDVLSLLIYTRSGTVKLTCDFSAKYCRISAEERLQEVNPDVAPGFCMLLRKHLQNAEVLSVEQVCGERVVCIKFKCFSEFEISQTELYLEIMGKYSNAVFVKNGTVLGALKTASLETGARRVILSGAKYCLPESQGKAARNDAAAIATALKNAEGYYANDAAKKIAECVAGVAYTTAQDIIGIYGENVSAEQIYDYLNDGEFYPCVIYDGGVPIDFKARRAFGAKPCQTLLRAQREYYEYAVEKKRFEDEKRKLNGALRSAIKKAEKRLCDTHDRLCECDKAEDIKLCGELITANIYAVERGMKEFYATNYYDQNLAKIKINLDPMLSPSQNAQKYYKRYAKLKRTEQNLSVRKREDERQLQYLKSIESNLAYAESLLDLKDTREELIALSLLPPPPQTRGKKAKPAAETAFREYEANGFTIVCGRNNVQNDRLTKSLSGNDVWLHAKAYHSAHVGIITDGKIPDDQTIAVAAGICAYYSDARENGKVPIDYTEKRNVKKPNGAVAGYFEYAAQKTILIAPEAHEEIRKDER